MHYSKNSIQYTILSKIVTNLKYYLNLLLLFYNSYSFSKTQALQFLIGPH